MVTAKELSAILGDETKSKIIAMLASKEMTLTEIFKAIPELKYRESAFKALNKLCASRFVKKRFVTKIRAYKYSTNFKRITINQKLTIKIA